jgi:hypothetical protein
MIWSLGSETPAFLDGGFPMPLDRPFTTAEAVAAGVTRQTLALLVKEGLLRRVLRGVYAVAQLPDGIRPRAQALALVTPPDAAVTDWTACWLHTGVLPPGEHLHVPPISIFRSAGKGRIRNALCDSGERAFVQGDVTSVDGVAVTTPLRTAYDLGRRAPRDWAIAALDALLRLGRFDRMQLLDGVERFRRQRGVVQLRELAPRADGRAESPGESVLRLRWTDLVTLPQPEPQVEILLPDGRVIYRIDLGVEDLFFGVEYDGEEHHSSAEDREHDRIRRRDLAERFDWLVIPVTKANVFGAGRDIERLLHEGVREARRRRGRFRPGA